MTFAVRNRRVVTVSWAIIRFPWIHELFWESVPAASTEEIHEAYRLKSKKHHPDLGGDEWAFRMVTRAYEVLKTTTTASRRS